MSIARTSVRVREDSGLCDRPFVSRSGEPFAWLDVGEDAELSVYGSPRAMRRLGEAVLAAADAADDLSSEREPVEVVARS